MGRNPAADSNWILTQKTHPLIKRTESVRIEQRIPLLKGRNQILKTVKKLFETQCPQSWLCSKFFVIVIYEPIN